MNAEPHKIYFNEKHTLKIYNGVDGKPSLICFFCPACGRTHPYSVNDSNPKHNWSFDGNMDAPTFAPSLRVFADDLRATACHLLVEQGKIKYQGDCPHVHANQTIDLPVIPNEED